jgi:hypothetical protein
MTGSKTDKEAIRGILQLGCRGRRPLFSASSTVAFGCFTRVSFTRVSLVFWNVRALRRGFDRTSRQIRVAFRRPRSEIARRGGATDAAAAATSASHGKLSAGWDPAASLKLANGRWIKISELRT